MPCSEALYPVGGRNDAGADEHAAGAGRALCRRAGVHTVLGTLWRPLTET